MKRVHKKQYTKKSTQKTIHKKEYTKNTTLRKTVFNIEEENIKKEKELENVLLKEN